MEVQNTKQKDLRNDSHPSDSIQVELKNIIKEAIKATGWFSSFPDTGPQSMVSLLGYYQCEWPEVPKLKHKDR